MCNATRAQAIATALSLHPTHDPGTSVSPVYDTIIDDQGQTISLQRVGGRYAAGYLRVSTTKQKEDGWSVAYQAGRIVDHCLFHKLAFRLYSDASLSGSIVINDAAMIEQMRKDKADRYSEVFNAVFLSEDRKAKLTALQIQNHENWLVDARARILKGEGVEGAPEEININRKTIHYRPALTQLIKSHLQQIHTVYCTDISRLARNFELTWYIVKTLNGAGVKFEGLIEKCDWFNDKNLGGVIQSAIIPIIQQFALNSTFSASMRGTLQALEEGKSISARPCWIDIDTNGFAVFNQEWKDITLQMIDLFLSDDDPKGYHSIAKVLSDMGIKSPREMGWCPTSVRQILTNPALYGVRQVFGADWQIFPPLIDESTFNRIQARINQRAKDHQIKKADYDYSNDYLLSGLLKCHCGTAMIHKKLSAGGVSGRRLHKYGCNANVQNKSVGNHPVLLMDDADKFFNDLMQNYSDYVIAAHITNDDIKELQKELNAVSVELAGIVKQIKASEAQHITEAKDFVSAQFDLSPNDADFPGMVQRRLDKINSALITRKETAELRLAELQADLNDYTPTDDIAAQIRRWADMSTQEKNRTLKQIYKSIQFVGDAPHERLQLIPRKPSKNPIMDIPITTKVITGKRQNRGKIKDTIIRRMPDIYVYLRLASAAKFQHDLQTGGWKIVPGEELD